MQGKDAHSVLSDTRTARNTLPKDPFPISFRSRKLPSVLREPLSSIFVVCYWRLWPVYDCKVPNMSRKSQILQGRFQNMPNSDSFLISIEYVACPVTSSAQRDKCWSSQVLLPSSCGSTVFWHSGLRVRLRSLTTLTGQKSVQTQTQTGKRRKAESRENMADANGEVDLASKQDGQVRRLAISVSEMLLEIEW
jgi:hypothetical protein